MPYIEWVLVLFKLLNFKKTSYLYRKFPRERRKSAGQKRIKNQGENLDEDVDVLDCQPSSTINSRE